MTTKRTWILTVGFITFPILLITAIVISGRETELPIPQEWSIQQVIFHCGKPALTIPDKYGEPGAMIYRSRHGGEFFLNVSEGRVHLAKSSKIEDLPCLASSK